MATADKCVTIHPYFKIHDGKLGQFKELCQRFIEKASTEPKCLYYGYSFDGNVAHCREGYSDSDGLLFHLQNVESLKTELMKLADPTRVEVHGSVEELAELRAPMADMPAQFFVLEYGFRK